jgi:hypothetical protein
MGLLQKEGTRGSSMYSTVTCNPTSTAGEFRPAQVRLFPLTGTRLHVADLEYAVKGNNDRIDRCFDIQRYAGVHIYGEGGRTGASADVENTPIVTLVSVRPLHDLIRVISPQPLEA